MANPIEFTPEDEEALTTDLVSLLEAEPTSAPGDTFSTQPDIPALREKLAVLVSTGKANEAIGVQLTHEQVKRLTDKEVEKYTKRYQAHVGSKTTESLIGSLIFLGSKLVGMAVDIDDIDAYQEELKNNYIINKELSNLTGSIYLKFGGGLLALANAVAITTKHINFEKNYEAKSEEIVEQSPPTAE